jgi:hypothetical protein
MKNLKYFEAYKDIDQQYKYEALSGGHYERRFEFKLDGEVFIVRFLDKGDKIYERGYYCVGKGPNESIDINPQLIVDYVSKITHDFVINNDLRAVFMFHAYKSNEKDNHTRIVLEDGLYCFNKRQNINVSYLKKYFKNSQYMIDTNWCNYPMTTISKKTNPYYRESKFRMLEILYKKGINIDSMILPSIYTNENRVDLSGCGENFKNYIMDSLKNKGLVK